MSILFLLFRNVSGYRWLTGAAPIGAVASKYEIALVNGS